MATGTRLHLVSDHEVGDVIAFYRDQSARTDAIVARLSLDDRPPGVRRPDLPALTADVRDVILHLARGDCPARRPPRHRTRALDGRIGLGPR